MCVNEQDGQGRGYKHTKKVRALFVDLDKVALPTTFGLDPSLIVKSSPGRHWLYWLIEPTDDFHAWQDCQKRLAAFYGGDPSVSDPGRVCRMPGFDHQKAAPFRVSIIKDMDDAARFEGRLTIAEVAAAHPCEYEPPATFEPGRGEPLEGWDAPDDEARGREWLKGFTTEEGDRNNAAFRAACMLRDFGLSPAKRLELLEEWNEEGVGLPQDEIEHVVRSSDEYAKGDAGSKSTTTAEEDFADYIEDREPTAEDFEGEPIKEKPANRFKPRKVRDLLALASPHWLVQGVLVEGRLGIVYGAPKAGKTLWAGELACCIATGEPFFGAKVKQGSVFYIIAEGSDKLFGYRIDSWCYERAEGDPAKAKLLRDMIDANMDVLTRPVMIDNAEEVKEFLGVNPKPRALLCIDTVFRCMRGDVTNATDFAKFIAGCDLIRRKLKTAVLYCHHQKRNDAKGVFGSIVNEASVDVEIKVKGDKKARRSEFRIELMRDGDPSAKPWTARVETRRISNAGPGEVESVAVLVFEGRGVSPADKATAILQMIYDQKPDAVEDLVGPGRSLRTVERILAKLHADGLVKQGSLELTAKGLELVSQDDEDADFDDDESDD